MIECIFTIDYEIYGNGCGALRSLVYEPAEKLMELFQRSGVRFVAFVEVAELEMIAARQADEAIGLVEDQVHRLHVAGHEIALHLHPQWYNARYAANQWELDYSEYNLCKLPTERIRQIVGRGIAYLQRVLHTPDFIPVSFRAGNWLFQPTQRAAAVLAEFGIRVDSSVFKGGRQRQHGLDYRPAARNGYYWTFDTDVNQEAFGPLLEIPIYTERVPFWRMLRPKRVALQQKAATSRSSRNGRAARLLDFMRLRYPRKFDFCRMTFDELTGMVERALRDDQRAPGTYKPLVAIGHTKDLTDFETVARFLAWLSDRGIKVTSLQEAYLRCAQLVHPVKTGAAAGATPQALRATS